MQNIGDGIFAVQTDFRKDDTWDDGILVPANKIRLSTGFQEN